MREREERLNTQTSIGEEQCDVEFPDLGGSRRMEWGHPRQPNPVHQSNHFLRDHLQECYLVTRPLLDLMCC